MRLSRCDTCLTPETILRNGLSNFEGQRLTKRRQALLKLHKSVKRVVIKRSCDWNRDKTECPQVKEFLKKNTVLPGVRRLCIKQTFRGGVVEPLTLAADAETIKQRMEEVYQRSLPDCTGSFLDINSMYPSQLTPSFSFSAKPVDYVMSPVGGSVVLLGPSECLRECDVTCALRCSRVDAHCCEEGVSCFQTCKKHFGPSQWGKLPGFSLVKILPPQDQRFPILRLRLSTDATDKNYSTLCTKCALTGVPFEGLKPCDHEPDERAIFGEFTSGDLCKSFF